MWSKKQFSKALITGLAFFAIALALYWPALTGPFISDDSLYILLHPWTAGLSLERLLGILDPGGDARFYQANYAPLHLLLTAFERQIFGTDPLGYHVVNVILHAANAAMLTRIFSMARLTPAGALLGGLLFLVHPANVEAVAWASQLKTSAALSLSLAALLTLRHHPLVATLLFCAALLTKASASVALPMAAALTFSDATPDQDRRAQWRWLLGWALLLVVYAVPQISAFRPRGAVDVPAYADLLVHLYTIASIGLRYLVMAATTYGISHTPEHPPVLTLLDPWTLCALPVAGLFIWRIAVTLRRRSVESVFWIGAACAFAPISQIIPFSYPMGDRYLYFILPGLLGGTLCGLRDAREALVAWLAARGRAKPSRESLGRVAIVVASVLLLVFANATLGRAHLWTHHTYLALDSARNFPTGRSALYLQAKEAAQAGDASKSVALLRRAAELGHDQFVPLLLDPTLAPVHQSSEFRALIHDLAGRYIDLIASRKSPTPGELRQVSIAHFERGELDEALRTLEQAVAGSGLLESDFASELEMLRAIVATAQDPDRL